MPENFWQSYSQFLPLGSAFRFGDEFAANLVGSSATVSGNYPPEVNRQIATTGPERFPVGDIVRSLDIFGPGGGIATGPDLATIEDRSKPTRFNDFMNRIGVGMLALILIAVGVLYLGLSGYVRAKDLTGGLNG